MLNFDNKSLNYSLEDWKGPSKLDQQWQYRLTGKQQIDKYDRLIFDINETSDSLNLEAYLAL